MMSLRLPDFGSTQNNISYNATKSVTRGAHAEPWDKYISIAAGEIFGTWADPRPGESFGQVLIIRLDPSHAIYVPHGMSNSFRTLQDDTVYMYLVDARQSFEQRKTYTFVNLTDPEPSIQWSAPLEESERSEADLHHPILKSTKSMTPKHTLMTGCNGQLGHTIHAYAGAYGLEGFKYTDIDESDFSDPKAHKAYDWSLYGTIVNADAYTAVDKAEAIEGRPVAWKTNARDPALLAKMAEDHRITLVYMSPDHVFDGIAKERIEMGASTPLGVYGQTKAAGDIAVANAPKHYILHSSWVIGEGHNFVKTIMMLSNKVAGPDDKLEQVTVVDNQCDRLAFTRNVAGAIFHLLDSRTSYGTYSLTGSSAVKSWADIAAEVFGLASGGGSRIKPINTVEYFTNATNPIFPRPVNSALDLVKIGEAGYVPADWEEALKTYMQKELG